MFEDADDEEAAPVKLTLDEFLRLRIREIMREEGEVGDLAAFVDEAEA